MRADFVALAARRSAAMVNNRATNNPMEAPMAVWAYECRPCPGRDVWLVARQAVDALPADVRILRVKTSSGWRCAVVDRSHAVEAEAMLLRDAVASDEADCPECAPMLAVVVPPPEAEPAQSATATDLQAAAISLQGHRMLVVLVRQSLLQSPGEADMLIADLRPRFGGIEVVLMGQGEDGAPHYHGDAELVNLLGDVPVDKMPWKAFPIG